MSVTIELVVSMVVVDVVGIVVSMLAVVDRQNSKKRSAEKYCTIILLVPRYSRKTYRCTHHKASHIQMVQMRSILHLGSNMRWNHPSRPFLSAYIQFRCAG